MKTLCGWCVCGVIVGVMVIAGRVWIHAEQAVPSPYPRVVYFPTQGQSAAEAVVILLALPDQANVCVELGPNFAPCARAGDLRRWIAGQRK